MSEEDWEHEYPEGSPGWKINQKIEAIEKQPLKTVKVLLSIFAILIMPVIIECLFQPFLNWRLTLESLSLAQYNTVLYAVTLLTFACACFYYGVGLLWDYRKLRKRSET